MSQPLPDHLRPGLRILFVGFNPGLHSVRVGHHYAGPSNRFWALLHRAGLTPRLFEPREDGLLPQLGYGLTNIVDRPTRSAAEDRTLSPPGGLLRGQGGVPGLERPAGGRLGAPGAAAGRSARPGARRPRPAPHRPLIGGCTSFRMGGGRQRMSRAAAAVPAAILVFLFLSAAVPPASTLEVGAKAPPFVNLDLQGQRVWSRDYLGKRWVLLDFFSTDCEGCRKELPILQKLQAEFGGRGLAVLVFATDPQGEAVVRPYFQASPTPLPVLLDNYQTVVRRYEVKEIPSLFLVDPQGTVVRREVGFREDLYEVLRALLAQRLP